MTNKQLKQYHHASEKERQKIRDYIRNIDDPLLKQIFKLRYIYGYSWESVAYHSQERGTASRFRMAVFRHLEKTHGK